jgi:hypothetical protein
MKIACGANSTLIESSSWGDEFFGFWLWRLPSTNNDSRRYYFWWVYVLWNDPNTITFLCLHIV